MLVHKVHFFMVECPGDSNALNDAYIRLALLPKDGRASRIYAMLTSEYPDTGLQTYRALPAELRHTRDNIILSLAECYKKDSQDPQFTAAEVLQLFVGKTPADVKVELIKLLPNEGEELYSAINKIRRASRRNYSGRKDIVLDNLKPVQVANVSKNEPKAVAAIDTVDVIEQLGNNVSLLPYGREFTLILTKGLTRGRNIFAGSRRLSLEIITKNSLEKIPQKDILHANFNFDRAIRILTNLGVTLCHKGAYSINPKKPDASCPSSLNDLHQAVLLKYRH